MFKNVVRFNVDVDKSKDMLKKISWQDQCILTELFNKYIPQHVREILPVDNYYVITWDNELSYNLFISEDLYKRITEILTVYGISVIFTEETV